MDFIILPLLFGLLVVVGSICGLIALIRLTRLERELVQLRAQLTQQTVPIPLPATQASPITQVPPPPEPSPVEVSLPPPSPPIPAPIPRRDGNQLERDLASRWLVWVGGVALALGGIFLVKFGVEHSVLGPTGRVLAGGVLGLVLLVASEWLRRHSAPVLNQRLGQKADYVPAALAGGGLIACYASLLTAHELYGLLGPQMTFGLLALTALLGLGLALVQGPLLAVLGLLGGYLVPVLVDTGHQSQAGLLGYVGLISLAALALQCRVRRAWLWWGTLLAHFAWYLLSWSIKPGQTALLAVYLLLSAYAFLALPGLSWRLHYRAVRWPLHRHGARPLINHLHWLAVILSLLCCIQLVHFHYPAALWLSLLGWLALSWCASRHTPALDLLPWLASLGLLLAVAAFPQWPHLEADTLAPAQLWPLWRWGMGLALLTSLSLLPRLNSRWRPGVWGSLLVSLPLLMLALLYHRAAPQAGSLWDDASIIWPLQALGLCLLFGLLSRRKRWPLASRLALMAGAQGGLTLALILYFNEQSLTLALAVQLASLCALARTEGDLIPHWLIKLLAAMVVTRLSLNPWLLSYPLQGVFGIHWSLYGYGIPVVCFFLAARWLPARPGQQTQAWLEAGALQLLTLWLSLEARYWLSGGQPWQAAYQLKDAAVHSCLWGALALIYWRKARLGGSLARVYAIAAPLLLGMMLLMTGLGSSLWLNPLWHRTWLGDWPLLNLTLPAWGLPAMLALLAWRRREHKHGWPARLLAGFSFISSLLFLTLAVRQIWRGGDIYGLTMEQGELYSHSAAWLLSAITLMLLGGWRRWPQLRRAALLMLLLTVCKIFLWDMNDLQGLYRAASFLGLGLSLVGLGWFYQHKVLGREEDPGGQP